ncbi:hypothetical protein [Hamadaea tsunoensis]|uniref:hypothetical protein n=1 Tax=Hamadaea tsunoensis TaxID=53368 RepID=UPI00040CA0B3|nr:hypothetical protein [Hamadaea tsunoensis]
MPTSVLLAVLTAAGLLALAPALVRRYDATERLVAERALSTARVLARSRRRRTVPGRLPVNPPRAYIPSQILGSLVGAYTPVSAVPMVSAIPVSTPARSGPRASSRRPTLTVVPRSAVPYTLRGATGGRSRARPAVYRRRRVLAALILFNAVELGGVFAVGPGFWIGFAASGTLLAVYVGHLRGRARQMQRRRAAEAAEARWLEEQQAEVRRAQRRRATARREAARLLQEELVRQRAALMLSLQETQELPKAVGAEQSAPVLSYRAPSPRGSRVRGKPYSAGPADSRGSSR